MNTNARMHTGVSSPNSLLGFDFSVGVAGEVWWVCFVSSGVWCGPEQCMTGDSWAEAVARPIVDDYPLASVYFITYFLVSSVMLVNMVVAVLIEKVFDSRNGQLDGASVPDYSFQVDQHIPPAAITDQSTRRIMGSHIIEWMREVRVPAWIRTVRMASRQLPASSKTSSASTPHGASLAGS